MTTARDIVKGALRKISAIGRGSSLSDEEAQDALTLLNGMLASWGAEGNLIFTETKETFPLTSSATYTIGSGGDFNTSRPVYIASAYITYGSTDEMLYEYDNNEYSAIPQKDISGIPEVYYYDANFPTATLYLYPTPSGADTITINSYKPLSSFSDLDTAFSMPAEYEVALVYNLAVLIAPEYETEALPSVQKNAISFKKVVEAQNNRNNKLLSKISVPAGEVSTFNIYRGY